MTIDVLGEREEEIITEMALFIVIEIEPNIPN